MSGAKSAAGTTTSFFADKGTKNVLDDAMGLGVDALGDTAKGAFAGFALGGPVGAAAGALVGMSSSIAKMPAKLMEWSEALVSSRRDLAMWSGDLQGLFRMRERRQFERDIESARETGPATTALGSSLEDLYDALRPIKDDVYKALALYLQPTIEAITKIVVILDQYDPFLRSIKLIADIADKYFGEQQKNGTNIVKWADAWRNDKQPSRRVPRR
jgi:hypothetical protein